MWLYKHDCLVVFARRGVAVAAAGGGAAVNPLRLRAQHGRQRPPAAPAAALRPGRAAAEAAAAQRTRAAAAAGVQRAGAGPAAARDRAAAARGIGRWVCAAAATAAGGDGARGHALAGERCEPAVSMRSRPLPLQNISRFSHLCISKRYLTVLCSCAQAPAGRWLGRRCRCNRRATHRPSSRRGGAMAARAWAWVWSAGPRPTPEMVRRMLNLR